MAWKGIKRKGTKWSEISGEEKKKRGEMKIWFYFSLFKRRLFKKEKKRRKEQEWKKETIWG